MHRPLPLPALQSTQGAATRRTLSIRHTVDQHGKPLAELIDNLSGLCDGLYPADLRHLARTLNCAANDLEQGERGLVVYCIQE